jgi:hypothetical protein
MTMPSYSVEPETPFVSMMDDMSAFSNIQSTTGSQNSDVILPLLRMVIFRSNDPTLDLILQRSIPGETDAESLIKNQHNGWCDNIINKLKNHIVERIFGPDDPSSAAFPNQNEYYKTMFRTNISLGFQDPNDATIISHDLQLRAIIKSLNFNADGVLYLWVRHTLFFPQDTFHGTNWDVVSPADRISPDRFARDVDTRHRVRPLVETVLQESPVSTETSSMPDPFLAQFTPPHYSGHLFVQSESTASHVREQQNVPPPAPPNPVQWYDPATSRIKIAYHCKFDEGFSDLPLKKLPPNVLHLQRMQQGSFDDLHDSTEITTPDFDISLTPFTDDTKELKMSISCDHPNFCFILQQDAWTDRPYLSDFEHNSSASNLATARSLRKRYQGALLLAIDDTPIYNTDEAKRAFQAVVKCSSSSTSILATRRCRRYSYGLIVESISISTNS